MNGLPVDMDPLMEIARKHNLYVVEDAAQAHGALYKGRPIGALGDIGCFSFCQDKIMTTGGEGGMLLTNSRQLWHRAWEFKDHGKSREAVFDRDDWRCAVPGCSSRRSLQRHHIVFASRGGGDEAQNLVTLCAFHHLIGVHQGIISIRGRAVRGSEDRAASSPTTVLSEASAIHRSPT